jgi:hypothetical protein
MVYHRLLIFQGRGLGAKSESGGRIGALQGQCRVQRSKIDCTPRQHGTPECNATCHSTARHNRRQCSGNKCISMQPDIGQDTGVQQDCSSCVPPAATVGGKKLCQGVASYIQTFAVVLSTSCNKTAGKWQKQSFGR